MLIVLIWNLFLRSQPNSFILIYLHPFFNLLLHDLSLLFLGISIIILIILNFDFIIILLWFSLFPLLSILISNFSWHFSGLLQINWEIDEFRVFLNQVFDSVLLSKLNCILFQVDRHSCSSSKSISSWILRNTELMGCLRFPNVLIIINVLWCHSHLLPSQETWIETNTKLTY